MIKKFWKNYGAYFGVVIGMLVGQLIVNKKIEHFLYTMIVIVAGFLVNVLIVNLVKYKKRNKNKEIVD